MKYHSVILCVIAILFLCIGCASAEKYTPEFTYLLPYNQEVNVCRAAFRISDVDETTITVSMFNYAVYSAEDLAAMKVGDTIITGDDWPISNPIEVTIDSIDFSSDYVWIEWSRGDEKGGSYLWPTTDDDNPAYYYERWSESVMFFPGDTITFPLGYRITFTDWSIDGHYLHGSIDVDPVALKSLLLVNTPGDEEYLYDQDIYIYIENGKVVGIEQSFVA